MSDFQKSDSNGDMYPLPEPSFGNRVRLLVNGNEALPAFLQMIEGARETIRLQVMLFDPDEIGLEIAAFLARAARRAVQVQVSFGIAQTINGTIADGYSRKKKKQLRTSMEKMLADLAQAGVLVLANPPGTRFRSHGAGGSAQANLHEIRTHTCISANHYDHRKLLIVDGQQVLMGGMNISRQYYYHHPPELNMDMLEEAQRRQQAGLPEGWEKWWDTSFVIDGPLASTAAREFDWKWEVLGGRPPAVPESVAYADGVAVQFLRQWPGRAESARRFFELIKSARREIFIASPFVSYEPALKALQGAARRGVRVVFVYPFTRQEMPVSRRIFLDLAGELIDAGVELYFNDLRMAHTKLLVVDGSMVMLGSLNLNYRSFLHDLEVTAIVADKKLADEVIQRVFGLYLQISRRVSDLPPVQWNPLNKVIRFFS